MANALVKSLSLVDVSGFAVITSIVMLLALGVGVTIAVRRSYARMQRDLRVHAGQGASFDAPVLNRIVSDTLDARKSTSGDVNTQAIIERAFQSELHRLLMGERFLRAVTGLMIILGLAGTFYGLTLSIGKLVGLLSGDAALATELTEALTRGLTQALSGMSVAFSTSLFGVVSAVVMSILGVLANVPDKRLALMVDIETYLDTVVLAHAARSPAADGGIPSAGVLDRSLHGFADSVARLEGVVQRFDQALATFSTSSRDFREFNHHLKDNVQRMSLSFADFSDRLQDQLAAITSRPRS